MFLAITRQFGSGTTPGTGDLWSPWLWIITEPTPGMILQGGSVGSTPRFVYKLNLSTFGTTVSRQTGLPGRRPWKGSSFQQWKSSRFFGADCAVDTTLQAGRVDDHRGVCHTAGPPHRSAQQDLWMCGCVESWPATQVQWTWHTAAAKKSQSSHNWSFQGILITECHGGGPPHGGLEGLVAAVEVCWSFILALTWSEITKPIWWAGFLTEENLTKPRRWQDDDKMASTRCCPNRWRFLPIGLSLQVILGRKGYPPKIPGGSPCISPTFFGFHIASSKLTWQQKIDLVKMYLLLNMGGFQLPCYFTRE